MSDSGFWSSTKGKFLWKYLGQRAHNIRLVQEFKPADHPRRRLQLGLEQTPRKKFIFSDEQHFWLNGFVNKQNCRIWSHEQLQKILQTPLHSKVVRGWSAGIGYKYCHTWYKRLVRANENIVLFKTTFGRQTFLHGTIWSHLSVQKSQGHRTRMTFLKHNRIDNFK